MNKGPGDYSVTPIIEVSRVRLTVGERVVLTKRLTEFPDLTTRASQDSWTWD